MLSHLSYRHHSDLFPYQISRRHHDQPDDNNGTIFEPFGEASLIESPLSRNATFRRRFEAQQQQAHTLQDLSFPSNQLFSSIPYSNDNDASEHMLRRKTPNGTLAAGYDGSPVEWAKRPHAMKHPMSRAAQTSRSSWSLATPFSKQSAAHSAASVAVGAEPQPGQQRHYSDVGIHTGHTDDGNLATNRKYSGMTLEGMDSVLNQSSLHNHPFNFPTNYSVPTVLQTMWPPCPGPTSIQPPGPFGPYWPNGAYEPYRPAPLRDPRFQSGSWFQYKSPPPQTQPSNLQSRGWPGNLDEDVCDGIAGPTPPLDSNYQNETLDHGAVRRIQQETLPHAFHTELAPEKKQEVRASAYCFDSVDGGFKNGFGTTPIQPHPINITGHAQFKEKILHWAHRIYCGLLASIEQTRREQQSNSAHTHGNSSYPQPPRRPYPSWSSKQHKHNTLCGDKVNLPADSPSVFGSPTHSLSDVAQGGNAYKREMSHLAPSPHEYSSHQTPEGRIHAQPPWLTYHQYPRSQQAYSSYVPAQLAQDHCTNSPSAAAANAVEILSRLCQESHWEWIDGMLLNGCLAYGLGDYAKATKWYMKVLHRDADNVEAMSNLAATLLSLGRRNEAEQYWMRSVKLRPSYFEAVEHLVGLLHEEHRVKEAVGIIEHVESCLGNNSPPSHCHQYSRISQHQLSCSGYNIPTSDNGRLLALIHGKGNVLYQSGDNDSAAKAFEEAILIGSGQPRDGICGLILHILTVLSEHRKNASATLNWDTTYDDAILLPPEAALETSRLVFPPHGTLPGLKDVPSGMSKRAAISIISNSLLSLAKIYQDSMSSSGASATAPRATSGVQEILALYYLSLSLQPSPSTANNVGILLAGVQQSVRSRPQATTTICKSQTTTFPGIAPGSGVALALAYYDYGLKLDARHAHLYTNLGSLFKDIGQLSTAIRMYEKAVDCDGNFDIALANLANAVKDKGNISDAIEYYRRAVLSNPDFAEAVCGLANALNSVCSWTGRGGIARLPGDRDRWHVDDEGTLYDSKKTSASSSGWIERVVSIVEKQLRDGKYWGKGVLDNFGIEQLIQQLGNPSNLKLKQTLRSALETWAEDAWEGAKVVRLVERATKKLGWHVYRDKYVDRLNSRRINHTRPQLPAALAVPSAPTVLPFHTFTCPLTAKQIRKISQRNGLRVSCSTLRAPWLPSSIYQPPSPPDPHLHVGYISSDFNNHPLAHLMQSVFGLHDSSRIRAMCYATTISDGSIHRQQIERESPVFYDASSWSIERLVNQVVADNIHILVNLNGYTRGAKNEVFAARPAPIQMSFMGFAGTLGAEWCDYLLADKMAIPPSTLRPWRGNVNIEDQTMDGNHDDDLDDWVYGENVIFTKETFFCCDHRQSAPDAQEPQLSWPDEQRRRWQMRQELFPDLADDAIVLGNFNQLYKVGLLILRTSDGATIDDQIRLSRLRSARGCAFFREFPKPSCGFFDFQTWANRT